MASTKKEEILSHFSAALSAVSDIARCEATLDRIFYSKQTVSIAPPPENFFNSYADNIYEEVRKAQSAYLNESVADNSSLPDQEPDQIDYPDNFGQVIGNRIREHRENAGLTQKELSDLTGIRRPNIARLEKGLSLPNLSTLLRISSGLQLSLENILRIP